MSRIGVDWEHCWDDLRFPATAVNPPGQASDPDFDTTDGGWLFAPSGTETLFFFAQLPHSWWEGTVLHPHVHWEKTTSAAGNVLWRFEYQWSVHRNARESLQTIDASTAVENFDIADTHMITPFGDLETVGKKISAMLFIKLSRIGGDAADTYGADARFLEFDIHYMRDYPGSRAEFDKHGARDHGYDGELY